MKRRSVVVAAACAAAAGAARAQASTRIAFGYTAVADFASVFVAVTEGYFAKRKLDVEPKLIPLNSTLPAALESDSLQFAGPTPTVFLQAVAGGLDHVVVAGGGLTSKSSTAFGLVARAGSGIRSAADCVGRRIGVPGIGAFLHVTFRAWLKTQGVDHRQVNFVEASIPQHGDLLRGGTVDAVVTADPFMSRILDAGTGTVVSYYGTFLPDGYHNLLFTARRDWAARNADAARAFREAIQEGAAFVGKPANQPAVRAAIGRYIKLPADVLARAQVSPQGPIVSDKQLAYWAGLMLEQGMLKAPLDVSRLVLR